MGNLWSFKNHRGVIRHSEIVYVGPPLPQMGHQEIKEKKQAKAHNCVTLAALKLTHTGNND